MYELLESGLEQEYDAFLIEISLTHVRGRILTSMARSSIFLGGNSWRHLFLKQLLSSRILYE